MVLKVDLQCMRCYKKVKKILCKFPQIRDQIYDEKANAVTITVICCSPEKIRDKLCYKGGGTIKSIEIKSSVAKTAKEAEKKPADKTKEPEKKAPEKPKEAEKKAADKPKEPEKKAADKPKEPEKKAADKPKEPEKKPEKPKEAEKPKEGGEKKAEKPKEDGEKKVDKPKEAAVAPAPAKVSDPAPLPPMAYAVGYSSMEGYYNGYGGGPSYYGGGPPQHQHPFPCYGRPVYDSWGGAGSGYYNNGHGGHGGYNNNGYGGHGGDYLSEENPQGCSIM